MVRNNLARKLPEPENEIQYQDTTYLPEAPKHTSISLSDIVKNNYRFEAGAYNLDAQEAINTLRSSKWEIVSLWSKKGFIKNASYPGRFKRIYVTDDKTYPFFLPSQLNEIYPKATKHISPKTYNSLNGVLIEPNMLLLSRSGTIGNCSISSKVSIGKVFSDDIIRISFTNLFDLGYTYAYFKTKIGQTILQTNNYGAVVQHIEPEHLEKVLIPNPPKEIKEKVHNLIVESFDLRDQSNELVDKAEKILYEELKLPPIEELKPKYFDTSSEVRNFQTKLSQLNLRFEGSYHVPIVNAIIEHLTKNATEIKNLGDRSIVSKIILPGRFKRIYVDKDKGVPFFGGKQLLELDPSNIKYLSLNQHGDRIASQLLLHENMVVVSRSGTIGKVNIVPKHWENWVLNEHVLRIIPQDNLIAGYIYCWLNTEYGYNLITRHTYGAVVDEIDDKQLSRVEIPMLKNKDKQKEINDLILQMNKLRYEAYLKEKEAIDIVNNDVIYASKD